MKKFLPDRINQFSFLLRAKDSLGMVSEGENRGKRGALSGLGRHVSDQFPVPPVETVKITDRKNNAFPGIAFEGVEISDNFHKPLSLKEGLFSVEALPESSSGGHLS